MLHIGIFLLLDENQIFENFPFLQRLKQKAEFSKINLRIPISTIIGYLPIISCFYPCYSIFFPLSAQVRPKRKQVEQSCVDEYPSTWSRRRRSWRISLCCRWIRWTNAALYRY